MQKHAWVGARESRRPERPFARWVGEVEEVDEEERAAAHDNGKEERGEWGGADC